MNGLFSYQYILIEVMSCNAKTGQMYIKYTRRLIPIDTAKWQRGHHVMMSYKLIPNS